MPPLSVPRDVSGASLAIVVWKFSGGGIDCGAAAADWVSQYLETPLRLVRFDVQQPRVCNPEWTQGTRAVTEFSDGYPVLVISRASLAELNSRLPKELPMARFRPNVVIDDVAAYDEDRIHELATDEVTLRIVKPCTRCSITTTDQERGALDGVEPLATLKKYRFDRDARRRVLRAERDCRARRRRGAACRPEIRGDLEVASTSSGNQGRPPDGPISAAARSWPPRCRRGAAG